MRIYGEAHMNFNRLKSADAEEAIDNFEHADTAVLILLRNAIHYRNHLLIKTWNQ